MSEIVKKATTQMVIRFPYFRSYYRQGWFRKSLVVSVVSFVPFPCIFAVCVYVLFSLSFGLPFTNQASNVRNKRQKKSHNARPFVFFFPFVLLECVYFQQRVNMSLGLHNVTFCVDLFLNNSGLAERAVWTFLFWNIENKKGKIKSQEKEKHWKSVFVSSCHSSTS